MVRPPPEPAPEPPAVASALPIAIADPTTAVTKAGDTEGSTGASSGKPWVRSSSRTTTRLELKHVRRAITRTKRKHRRQQFLGVLVTVVLLAGLVGTVIYLTGHDRNGRDAVSTTTGPGVRTQHTLLFQVRSPDGPAMSSALLARDSKKKSAAVVLVPNRVVAQVPGSGTQPFGLAVDQPDGPAVSRSTLADLLGVRVDASWVLDQAAFTHLVDAVDGIKVDIDVDIIGKQGSDTVVVVPKGRGQQLSGTQALSVLSYRATGEDELATLPRFQHVLAGLLAKLPSGSEQLTTLAGKVGKGSEISSMSTVTSVLDGVRSDSASGRSSFQIMPVLTVDTNGEANYRIESGGVTKMVNGVLAGSRLPGRFDQGNRVLVLNQVGTPGLGQAVRDRIVAADFVFVDSRNQKPFGRTKTIIVVFDTMSMTKVRASQLATALGLPQADVQVSDRAQNIADAIVYLGSDFKP